MLFVPHSASYHLQFISYLGVLQAIFLHFQWLTFFLDPARCWLNSCLQPWCQNITENDIIILKLVNKELSREPVYITVHKSEYIRLQRSPAHRRRFSWNVLQKGACCVFIPCLFPSWTRDTSSLMKAGSDLSTWFNYKSHFSTSYLINAGYFGSIPLVS